MSFGLRMADGEVMLLCRWSDTCIFSNVSGKGQEETFMEFTFSQTIDYLEVQ